MLKMNKKKGASLCFDQIKNKNLPAYLFFLGEIKNKNKNLPASSVFQKSGLRNTCLFFFSHTCPLLSPNPTLNLFYQISSVLVRLLEAVYQYLVPMHGHLSLVMRKPDFAKTKPQISFAVTAKLISAFVFATWIVQSLYYLNPKFQASIAIFCGCTAPFVWDLVENPEDQFSHNKAHLILNQQKSEKCLHEKIF